MRVHNTMGSEGLTGMMGVCGWVGVRRRIEEGRGTSRATLYETIIAHLDDWPSAAPLARRDGRSGRLHVIGASTPARLLWPFLPPDRGLCSSPTTRCDIALVQSSNRHVTV